MTKKKKRYQSEPLRYYDISDSYCVSCPSCKGMALIELPSFLDAKKASARCLCCDWRTHYSERIVYSPSPSARCASCRSMLPKSRIVLPQPNAFSYQKCSSCDFENKVMRWEKKLRSYPQSGKSDPILGLPLFFQKAIGPDVLWVINARHLEEILKYVGSDLRERTTTRFKMTLVEKLPKFITKAENRVRVIKILTDWKEEMKALESK